MKKSLLSKAGKETFIFLLLLAASIVLYLYRINFSDIWIDESFTKALVDHSMKDIIDLLIHDFHPPFYFLTLKIFTWIAGVSDFSIRLFSLIGAVCTIILGYVKGQKVFGKTGALYFCFFIFSLPMIASYSHDARMYTWSAFLITGVFLYAVLYIRSHRISDLVFLGLFSLMAAYTHYFSLIAIFWANLFALIFLIITRKKTWIPYLIMVILLVILYLPWMFVMFAQTGQAQQDFWIQPVTLQTILSCYLEPFVVKFQVKYSSIPLIVIIYGLSLITIINNIRKKTSERLPLALSLVIFHLTLLTTAIISLFIKPILYPRYIMTIVTMLLVPPVIYFIQFRKKILNWILLGLLFIFGVFTAVSSSGFSFGPYKQCMQYLHNNYPEIQKIVHSAEITTGPLINHNYLGDWQHFWINSHQAVYYTNLDVFDNLALVDDFDQILKENEKFCLVHFRYLPLNKAHNDSILTAYQLIQTDTVKDVKMKNNVELILYFLQKKDSSLVSSK